jgi:hypothetical protein
MLAIPVILVFGFVYGGLAIRAYQKQTAPWLVLELWGLGLLNILVGAVFYGLGEGIGAFPLAIGVISIELGTIMQGYWHATPNWNHHALRIAIEVFVVGLLFI